MRALESRETFRDDFADHRQEASDGLRRVHDFDDDRHVLDERPGAALQQPAVDIQPEEAAKHGGAGEPMTVGLLHESVGR